MGYKLAFDIYKEEEEKFIDSYKIEEVTELELNNEVNAFLKTDIVEHLHINGHSLLALDYLNKKYKNEIDVVYIETPYIESKKQNELKFKNVLYEDKVCEWLSYMKRRMELSMELISDKGLIIICVDEALGSLIKILGIQTFDKKQYLGEIIRKVKTSTNCSKSGFNIQHEYIYLFCKDKSKIDLHDYIPYGENEKKIKNYDATKKRTSDKNYFPIKNPFTNSVSYPPKGRTWIFSEEECQEYIKNETIVFKKCHSKNNRNFFFFKKRKFDDGIKYTLNSLSMCDNDYLNISGNAELNNIIGYSGFEYPKPSEIFLNIFRHIKGNDIKVLDLISGHGAVTQAIMELNKEDNGKRTAISVCLNKNNELSEDVFYKRTKSIIKGYTTPKGKYIDGLVGNKLRYYKIENGI